MIITILKESNNEPRVALTPNVVKQYDKLGISVVCEKNAGIAAGFSDNDYQEAGATIATRASALKQAEILALVNAPNPTELKGLSKNALIIASIDNNKEDPLIKWATDESMSLFSMNLIPRISRAQSMDSLSSQANVAGYRAVLEGIQHFHRVVPMMMTAAGMIHPTKILILGAGVAGLQAIATAKRLGAVVYAFDVRRAAKEQVESLGAEFIEVNQDEDNETSGGYASEMSPEYQQKQAELIDEYAKKSDIIICTALIPGKKAPILIKKETVNQMKKGSVIVDLAAARGGNCELSLPDQILTRNGVTIVGYSNMAGMVATTASELYAVNILNLIKLVVNEQHTLHFDPQDEIIKQALLCHEGKYQPYLNVQEKQHA